MTAPSLLDELEGVVAYAWRKDGMKGWALGHNPPTQNMLDFDKYEVRELAFRTHHAELADMAKRLEAAERGAFKWQLLCADCDDAGEGNRAAINVVNDACRLGSGALERHYGQAARDGLDAAIAATQEGEG